ncbi:50S ribosomal protein [Sporothrix schenckii 1099-18]|uniref:Large ribosomal subunit protein bL27m n=1 Tax=Sporothrix schenckii 1099-18 TaxID=1397361 RepID=A0A0F2MEC8_SPOSC|nr:50S ribosomal protein [Sporothrix schenckii 1099-18]KJR88033.1 50S ribosomal protein [Sporothrix schenckii 1099-18]
MRLMQLRLPIRAAVKRPTATPLITASTATAAPTGSSSLLAANTAVEGQRFASVKAQGAYRVTFKKTIPKKMGAKRVGDQYVLPGTIIYKQRGTLWFPGENTILGRDHTIHAAVAGYVKYYRDPYKHPDRQYIGVTFNRNDTLPYHPHAARKRRLGMVAVPRKPQPTFEPLTRSGIPRRVIRRAGVIEASAEPSDGAEAQENPDVAAVEAAEAAANEPSSSSSKYQKGGETKAARAARRWNAYIRIKRSNRVLFVGKNYQYRESNFQIGRLMGTHKGKTPGTQRYGSRHAILRHRRKKRDEQLRIDRELARQQHMISADKSNKNTGKASKKMAKAEKKAKEASKKVVLSGRVV